MKHNVENSVIHISLEINFFFKLWTLQNWYQGPLFRGYEVVCLCTYLDFIAKIIRPVSWYFNKFFWVPSHSLTEATMTWVEETVISRLISLEWVWWRLCWSSVQNENKPFHSMKQKMSVQLPRHHDIALFQQTIKKVFKWFASIFVRYLFVKLF